MEAQSGRGRRRAGEDPGAEPPLLLADPVVWSELMRNKGVGESALSD